MIGPLHPNPTVETSSIADSGNTLVVLLVTLFLLLAALALTALAVWYWRSTIPDPESLGPLHSMSTRKYANLDIVERRRVRDSSRPSLVATTSSEAPVDPAAGVAFDEPEAPSEVEHDDDVWPGDDWPGDDWPDRDAPTTREPEPIADVRDDHPRVEPQSPLGSTPIDPLIT